MPFNPDRINIHELTIEEPEKETELPFDVERDITPKDWEKLDRLLEINHLDKHWFTFVPLAKLARILDPTRKFDLTEEDREEIKKSTVFLLEKNCDSTAIYPWSDFLNMAAEVKIIDSEINLNIKKSDWDYLRYSTETKIPSGMFQRNAADLKIIDPNVDIEADEETVEDLEKHLKSYMEGKILLDPWFDVAEYAANIKIIGLKINLDLNKDAWKNMLKALKRYRNIKPTREFFEMAAYMKILAAEKVEVTDKGLEITMPKKKQSLDQDVPPMPEVKKF